MAHKRIEDGKIRTTNGVDTITYPVYVKNLGPYTPRPDGWNQELAEAVYAWIEGHRLLWNQNVWRNVVPLESDTHGYDTHDVLIYDWQSAYVDVEGPELEDLQKAIRSAMATAATMQDGEVGSCGTTMCLAGWVAEFAGADWVLDASLLTKDKVNLLDRSDFRRWSEKIFVPINEIQPDGRKVGRGWDDLSWMPKEMSPLIRQRARERGFTPETHDVWDTMTYASHMLGIGDDGTMKVMFEGGNTLEDLRAAIDFYNEHGPEADLQLEMLPSGSSDDRDDD